MSASEIDPAKVPQDPYLPQEETISGPIFLDSGACLCAYRDLPDDSSSSSSSAWQCIGNQSQSVYEATTGKWFESSTKAKTANLTFYDVSHPPTTSSPLLWDAKSKALKKLADSKSLTVYDQACTGKNATKFSTTYYEALRQSLKDELPMAATPCWRPDALPMQLQGVDSWLSNGCSEGFLCENNTINSLPLYCPPIPACQIYRLSGLTCTYNGRNVAMGPFEPVVCQQGWYCPVEEKGKKTFRCPAGSYCQPGASTPTPCSVGSRCPEGSSYQLFLIPIIVLILVDILMLVGVAIVKFRNRFKASSRRHMGPLKNSKGLGGVSASITGYKELQDDPDQEMVPMNLSYAQRQETWMGFESALDMAGSGHDHRDKIEAALPPHLRAFIESMRKATDATNFGLSFGYQDLVFHPKGCPRPILQNVTGSIQNGQLVAVMGGSGAGKSTFVNVLMGKASNTGGVVSVNNAPGKMKRYKKLTGYVPQDDIVLPELTVYENIAHSARVRLPRTWSKADVEAHVDSVVDCLELSHVRDSMVGSVGKPVISGGQRKRVSIGMELAAAPMAIFLDEPTSGLDATAASSMMRTLKAIARLGISVIVIIHQPRTEIFDLFDHLILLGNGQTIYEGTQADATPYFERVGFHFPEHCNHADVITDIITGNGRDYKPDGDIDKETLIARWAAGRESSRDKASRAATTASMLGGSSLHQALRKRGASRVKQLRLCLSRAFLQQYRTKGALLAEMGLATLAGALLGLAENPKKGVLFVGLFNEPYGVLSTAMDFKSAPELALLMAIAIGLVAGAPGVKIFSEEMMLHKREAEAGHSRVAYFFAKALSVLPRMALSCLHFTTAVLLLAHPVIDWGLAFLANLLYFYCIYGLASVVSMLVRREDAPLLATMISLITGILCGAAPQLRQVSEWHMEWLWRASPATWYAELYFGRLVAPFEYLFNVEAAVEVTGYHLDRKWLNVGVMAAIGTAYRAIAYVGMVAAHRLRRG